MIQDLSSYKEEGASIMLLFDLSGTEKLTIYSSE